MRQLKFRAWDGKEMINMKDIGCYSPLEGGWSSMQEMFDTEMQLMQFTGLKDNSGKDIFEGDIIQSMSSLGFPIRHTIVFKTDVAQFVAEYDTNTKLSGYSTISQNWMDEFKKEVIGNRFENPELL